MRAFVTVVAAALFLGSQSPARERRVTACGVLDEPGTTYILEKDLASPGTCFSIQGDRITLDLNHHTITYGTAFSWEPGQETTEHVHGVLGQACWDKGADAKRCGGSFAFLTVKHGTIVQAAKAPPYSHGIRLGQGSTRGLTAEDLRIQVQSPSSVGIWVLGGDGGHLVRNVVIENRSDLVFNRHQLEGVAVRFRDMAKANEPNRVEGLKVIGGPQGGVLETAKGSKLHNNHISLKGVVTNDFGFYLMGEAIEAAGNTVDGQSRGIMVASAQAVVRNNLIRTHEAAVNEEYGGCQIEGTFGIQLEARAAQAKVMKNDVRVLAEACDARAFRATETKANSANVSTGNIYRAVRAPGSNSKAVGASFSGARDVTLEGDTIEADTSNAEAGWSGAQNIVFRGVTFIKGAHASADYATFWLTPGSNNPQYRRTSADFKIIDPIFRDGAAADSFRIHPIGYEKWAMPAEYSVQWSFRLQVTQSDGSPLAGVKVDIADDRGNAVSSQITDKDGRITPAVLTEFRRFNTPQGVEKETFVYVVRVVSGALKKEFKLSPTAPTSRVEVLP